MATQMAVGASGDLVLVSKDSKGRALLARRYVNLLSDARSLMKQTSEQVHACY